MNLEEIFSKQDPTQSVQMLRTRNKPVPDIGTLKGEYSPIGHKIYDMVERPDKEIRDNNGNLQRFEKVARISLPLQKLIVDRAVAFLFGNPAKLLSTAADDVQYTVFESVRQLLLDNKIDSHNRKIARILMSETEVAELWYPVGTENFWQRIAHRERSLIDPEVLPANKLKVAVFSPSQGDKLYPLFDDFGDMVAFSREFKPKTEKGKEYFIFETYTAEKIYRYKSSNERTWELIESRENILGKIPVIYMCQTRSEWADVQPLIERLEKLLSNFADTNDYHSSPKIFVTGEIRGFARKGEAGAIIEGEQNATASYLSWQHAPESVRLEIDTLLKMIYSATQTPDISFDSVKGLGNLSGVALKMLFLDAHLKVNNKEEIFNDFLARRINILTAYLGKLVPSMSPYVSEVEITQQIEPFMIEDVSTKITSLLAASGNKAILSQKTALSLSGMVSDAQAEYEQLEVEKEQDRQSGMMNNPMVM